MLVSQESGQIRHTFILYIMAYILISHIAVSAHTAVVKKFGGVAAVFVGTARKGMTLILSFLIFPKESNWKYAVGAILVLGGLTVASLEKQRNKHKQFARKASDQQGKNGNNTVPTLPSLSLPLSTESNHSEDQCNNGEGGSRSSERQSLMESDMELGRSSTSSINRPERRR